MQQSNTTKTKIKIKYKNLFFYFFISFSMLISSYLIHKIIINRNTNQNQIQIKSFQTLTNKVNNTDTNNTIKTDNTSDISNINNNTEQESQRLEALDTTKDTKLKSYTDNSFIKKNKLDLLNTYQKVLLVNLEDKTITFKDSDKIIEYNVATIGPNESFYETPSGVYTIKTKTKNHFSSIGHVYMPYSMQFFGNFFIHGIPYYEDGTEVSSEYSGGCIRMETEKIRQIYEQINIGDTIVIVKDSFIKDKTTNIQSDDNIAELAKQLDTNKMDRILLSLIILEFVNVNKKIILTDGTQIKGLETLSQIINKDNKEYINIMSKTLYGLDTYKIQKLHAVNKSFKVYTKYDSQIIWSDLQNKIDFLLYVKDTKGYLYKKISTK